MISRCNLDKPFLWFFSPVFLTALLIILRLCAKPLTKIVKNTHLKSVVRVEIIGKDRPHAPNLQPGLLELREDLRNQLRVSGQTNDHNHRSLGPCAEEIYMATTKYTSNL